MGVFGGLLSAMLTAMGTVAGNINKAPINLNAKIITNASGTMDTLINNIVWHFVKEVLLCSNHSHPFFPNAHSAPSLSTFPNPPTYKQPTPSPRGSKKPTRSWVRWSSSATPWAWCPTWGMASW